MTYLIQEDVKNNEVIILMYEFIPKPTPPNPIVSGLVDSINKPNPNATEEEQKIAGLIPG